MSLTVVKRPHDLGYPWMDTETSITVTNSAGSALVTHTTHGYSTGDLVYLLTTVSDYNGVWYITVIGASTYTIHEYSTAAAVSYIVDATGIEQDIVSTSTAPILPVHLPIVYKIQSSLWPVNGADTARTVSSFTNRNGYTYLALSGTLHTGSTVLESVTIVGTSSLDGIYRIIEWLSPSNIVIDLAYSASNSFSGGTVQYYYMNYHARVRVYAGITSGSYTALKPSELLAELRCLPDSTGLITVNINEIVKKQIDILANNTLSPTLPYNLEANTNFYISVAESYDDSDGYTVSEYVSSYTDDNSAVAVNAKLPFKDRQLGMGQYIGLGAGQHLQKFLTLFDEPTMTPGQYFDISFIARTAARIIRREIYVNDVKVDQFDYSMSALGPGIHRYSFTQSGWSEDRVDLTLLTSGGTVISETITINVDNECYNNSIYLTWLNYLGGFDYWNFTARKTSFLEVEDSQTQEKNILPDWPNSYGEGADSIQKQTYRRSRNSIHVESGHLTQDQVDAIKWVLSSPLVQIMVSAYDRRTVIVEPGTFQLYKDQQDLFTLGFNVKYTDEVPSQSL